MKTKRYTIADAIRDRAADCLRRKSNPDDYPFVGSIWSEMPLNSGHRVYFGCYRTLERAQHILAGWRPNRPLIHEIKIK